LSLLGPNTLLKIVYIYIVLLTDDYNRVVLEPLDDTPDSDYVNASYVDVSKLFLHKYFVLLAHAG